MAKDQIESIHPIESEDGYIDDVDRSLSPYGRFLRHNHMHGGVVPMVLDEFGRCAHCVQKGFWRPNG